VLFNSFEFFIFLPVVFILYWFIFKKTLRLQNILILVASYFFYGWWSYKFLGLLALSTLLDYIYGFSVASPNRKKAKIFLWLSIINNLGILGVFKYYNFFATQFQDALGSLGLQTNPIFIHIVLPIGISFYTFHGLSYVFDIYRGKQKPVSNFIDYAVFVCFFPLLIAGPIERANHLLPQVQRKRSFDYTQATEGCRLIIWGLFKKIVIADGLAKIVDDIFNNYQDYNGLTLIIGAIGFSFQIYGDFSGYSDIAIGTAKLFGFELLSNFKFPYFSRDIAEFWRRWHISLSSWFRDYLYIPLGGSKEGKLKAVRNIFIIFILSGFWHGANWTFIAWGLIHACGFLPLLLLNRNRTHSKEVVAYNRSLPNLRELSQMATTFSFVTLAWIFFRAKSIGLALGYLKHIFGCLFNQPSQLFFLPGGKMIFLYIIPLILADWWLRRDERKLKPTNNMYINFISYSFLFYLSISLMGGNSTFIYFQF
jgi:alginate O-acetyltransferase complex protein AlgI